jgi:hypothetical protein
MFILSMLCPTYKKGEMEEKSVITGIGAVASPAFAGGHDKKDRYDKKGDSSATATIQVNKQKQKISGFGSEGTQDASNCITVKRK